MSTLKNLFVSGQSRGLSPGEVLFRIGEPVRNMYLICEGEVTLVRHSSDGARMVLHRAGPAQVPAEASAHARAYHCDGVAVGATRVRALPVAAFKDRLRKDPDLALLWSAQLAHSLQAARLRSEIRGLRTVSERLETWLTDRPLPPRGAWQDLAAELGVSREALYRALSRRR